MSLQSYTWRVEIPTEIMDHPRESIEGLSCRLRKLPAGGASEVEDTRSEFLVSCCQVWAADSILVLGIPAGRWLLNLTVGSSCLDLHVPNTIRIFWVLASSRPNQVFRGFI